MASFKQIMISTSQFQLLSKHMNYVAMEHKPLDVSGLSDLHWHSCN